MEHCITCSDSDADNEADLCSLCDPAYVLRTDNRGCVCKLVYIHDKHNRHHQRMIKRIVFTTLLECL